jgi:hypothetical protein
MIGWLLALALLAAPACGGGSSAVGTEPAHARLGSREPGGQVIACTEPAPGAKVRAHFAAGSSLRDLVVWYTAVTCNTVVASSSLLDRTSPHRVDAMVSVDRVEALFRSRLGEIGLAATVIESARLVLVSEVGDAAVFTGVAEPGGGAGGASAPGPGTDQ